MKTIILQVVDSAILTYFQFHGTPFHLVLVLFVSLKQKYGIHYLLTFCSLKHSSFRRHLKTLDFQSAYPGAI